MFSVLCSLFSVFHFPYPFSLSSEYDTYLQYLSYLSYLFPTELYLIGAACQSTLSQSRRSIAAICSDPPCDTLRSTLDPHQTLCDVWPNIMASQEEELSEPHAIISVRGRWLASSVVFHQILQLYNSSKKTTFDLILPSQPRLYHVFGTLGIGLIGLIVFCFLFL